MPVSSGSPDSLTEPIRKKVGGSLSRLPPLQRVEMLRRNALMLRGGQWKAPQDDGTLVRKVVGLARGKWGGLAVTLHGYVWLTEDVHILIEDSVTNIGRLLSALEGFGEGWARDLSLEDFGPEEGAIRVVEEIEHCQIDFFMRMSGLRFEDLVQDAEAFTRGGCTIRFASKTALIRLKSRSVREKDQLDVLALQQLLEDPDAFA